MIKLEGTDYPSSSLAVACVCFPIALCCCCIASVDKYSEAFLGGSLPSIKSPGGLPMPSLYGRSQIQPEDEDAQTCIANAKFRKLTEEDFVGMMPGLRLRVCGGRPARWYAATACDFNKKERYVDVQCDNNDVHGKLFNMPHIFYIDKNKVVLHEDACRQMAKKRIMAGVVNATLFNGSTFTSLDSNGDGFLYPEDLQRGLQAHGIELGTDATNALLQLLDTNSDGKISAAEFRSFLVGEPRKR